MPKVKKVWTTIELDAEGKAPGRFASEIARILIGKHRADYAPNGMGGDSVRVKNVRTLKISKKQMETKVYTRHSGYPGGLRTRLMKDVLLRDYRETLRTAVDRMLPKNRLRALRMKRLTIE